jgi:signal transduction histidine kinase
MIETCTAGGGPAVTVTCRGERRPLPRAVDTTAYRIAQESLTNVLRHAAAGSVEVTLDYRPDGLRLDIRDDGRQAEIAGRSPRADGDGGYGIRGMAERAGSLGGWLTAGPEHGGGFRVRAWLPAREGMSS